MIIVGAGPFMDLPTAMDVADTWLTAHEKVCTGSCPLPPPLVQYAILLCQFAIAHNLYSELGVG